jgi:quercetin dioxygenase-like cupin family protein
MKVKTSANVEQKNVEMPGAERCKVRQLIGSDESAPNFAMRQFEVAAGGFTPRHSHPYEHEIFILEGQGIAVEGEREHPIQSGDTIYVAPDEVHQFRNTGDEPLKFLCLVPNSAANQPVTLAPEGGTR